MTDKPILTQRGGARRGWANSTWPFERLDVFEDRLVLSGQTIRKGEIEELRRHKGFFSVRLRIRRKVSNELLVFWTFNYPALESALRQAGFQVSG